MSDPFASAKRRLSRGKKHIAELDEQVSAFFRAQPYTCVIEPHPDGIHTVYKAIRTKLIPDDFMDMAADAVDNLRSALDQASYAVAKTSSLPKLKNTKFPFAENSKEFEGRLRTKDFPEDIKPLFRSFEPYKGGNDLLWALNKICNTNKHQILTQVCIFQATQVYPAHVTCDQIIPLLERDGAKSEIIFTTESPDTKADYHVFFHIIIAFDQIEVVKGQPLIATLNKMASMVESILASIEEETRKLGYFPAPISS